MILKKLDGLDIEAENIKPFYKGFLGSITKQGSGYNVDGVVEFG